MSDEEKRAVLNKLHRSIWVFVTILAKVVAFFAGLAFGLGDFWIAPTTGVMAMAMVLVLVGTLYLLSAEPVDKRRERR